MTVTLTALILILCLLLWLQHRRNRFHLGRLAQALDQRDRDALRSGGGKRSPAGVRNLERQILDQLSKADKLRDRVERREQLLSAVVEGLGEAVLVFDGNTVLRFANSSASEIFGWETPPQGTPAAECIRSPALLDLLRGCIRDQGEARDIVSHRIPGSAGPEAILEADVAPLRIGRKGSVSRARLVLSDRTEAHELEQVRKDFVANASHELRTPLTIINGYLENLLDMGIADEETTLRFLGVMQKHGDRIARIVEDMLTISKLESGGDSLDMQRFDLKACAAEVVGRLNPLIERKEVVVSLEFPEDTHLSGDAFYWDQILFNLIENALKENEAPGLRVRVRLQRDHENDIVSVSDDGVGIPRAALPFIFKRFYRVDSSRAAEKKGTGLGLSIVKRAVEAHGGKIEIESVPGQCTEVRMTVPRPAQPARAEVPGGKVEPAGK